MQIVEQHRVFEAKYEALNDSLYCMCKWVEILQLDTFSMLVWIVLVYLLRFCNLMLHTLFFIFLFLLQMHVNSLLQAHCVDKAVE